MNCGIKKYKADYWTLTINYTQLPHTIHTLYNTISWEINSSHLHKVSSFTHYTALSTLDGPAAATLLVLP